MLNLFTVLYYIDLKKKLAEKGKCLIMNIWFTNQSYQSKDFLSNGISVRFSQLTVS